MVVATKWLTIALAVALAAYVLAQTPAARDLTGTWVYNPARSKVVPTDPIVPSHTITITRVGKTYAIVIRDEIDEFESTEVFTMDGHERSQGPGGRRPNKAAWKGRLLVTSRTSPVDSMLHVQRWSLSSDGHTLTCERDDPDLVFVYDRQ
jgi:hypothetical protein